MHKFDEELMEDVRKKVSKILKEREKSLTNRVEAVVCIPVYSWDADEDKLTPGIIVTPEGYNGTSVDLSYKAAAMSHKYAGRVVEKTSAFLMNTVNRLQYEVAQERQTQKEKERDEGYEEIEEPQGGDVSGTSEGVSTEADRDV